uniref:Uncharacterized protein n=1 Tax=Anopheles dirus TaxID=7168 RepID=A0A182NVX7_9DIPT
MDATVDGRVAPGDDPARRTCPPPQHPPHQHQHQQWTVPDTGRPSLPSLPASATQRKSRRASERSKERTDGGGGHYDDDGGGGG